MTTGSPPSMTAMTELVVPKSIPTVFGICRFSSRCAARRWFEFLCLCLSPGRRPQNRLEARPSRLLTVPIYELDPVDRIAVAAVGEPGQRQFFLLATG